MVNRKEPVVLAPLTYQLRMLKGFSTQLLNSDRDITAGVSWNSCFMEEERGHCLLPVAHHRSISHPSRTGTTGRCDSSLSGYLCVFRRPEMIYFLKSIRVLLNYLVWVLGLILAHSRSWRVWEFDSDVVSVMFIGLWEAFYRQKFNVSGIMVELPMYSMINSSWVISDEISYGQGLMLLANFMMSAALIFSSVALFVSRIKAPYPDFLRLCYKAATLLLFLSCACITVAVSWNFTVDFYGQTTLDFPITFPVERQMVTNKRLSYVFPLGTTTSILLLINALLFFCETCSIKPPNRVNPLVMSEC